MGRPKYKKGETDAQGKIADAFWALISERPYGEITVLDIVRKAELNKNTFYYHYSGIDEMSKDVVEQSLDPEAFKRMLSTIEAPTSSYEGYEDNRLNQSFKRFGLIASDNSSPALKDLLKKAIGNTWCEMFGIDMNAATFEDVVSFEFALGGIMAVMALRPSNNDSFSFREAMASDFREDVISRLKLIAEHTKT